jgi:hypothetical protein
VNDVLSESLPLHHLTGLEGTPCMCTCSRCLGQSAEWSAEKWPDNIHFVVTNCPEDKKPVPPTGLAAKNAGQFPIEGERVWPNNGVVKESSKMMFEISRLVRV